MSSYEKRKYEEYTRKQGKPPCNASSAKKMERKKYEQEPKDKGSQTTPMMEAKGKK